MHLSQPVKIWNKFTSERERSIVWYNFPGKSLKYLAVALRKCQFRLIKTFRKVLFYGTVSNSEGDNIVFMYLCVVKEQKWHK